MDHGENTHLQIHKKQKQNS